MFKLTNKIVYVSMKYFKSFQKFKCITYSDKSFTVELYFNDIIQIKFTNTTFWVVPLQFKKLVLNYLAFK